MRKISIVYNQPLSQIQGINYVNNSFVVGSKYFKEHGLELDKIYAPDGVFDCTTHDYLDIIGADVGSTAYNIERRIRVFFRDLLSSKYFLGASIKKYFNHTLNARKAIGRMVDNKDNSDYLIFQDTSSVRQYYSKFKNKSGVKSILILHCSNHPLEQLIPTFPGYFKYNCLKERAFRECEEAMRMVDKVVYLSSHAMDVSPLDNEKKTYIFNGVEDLSEVHIVPPSKPLQLVCVGSVTTHKGQKILLEALSLLDDKTLEKLHMTIVGGGDEFETCKQIIESKRLNHVVTMTGPRNDVSEILKTMDVFLLPSISEGMPMSILEAMRQGLFIMATKVGGIPEMINEGYGLFITRDPNMLATTINNLLVNEMVTIESKQKSRKRYEEDFTLKKMIGKYSELLLSM